MMSKFFARAALFVLAFIPTLTLCHISKAQATPAAIQGIVEGCEGIPQPCWYGIIPGQSLLNEAIAFIEELGVTPQRNDVTTERVQYYFMMDGCRFNFVAQDEGSTVDYIGASSCEGLRLGDVMDELGMPFVRISDNPCDINLYVEFPFMEIHPSFRPTTKISPLTRIDSFLITSWEHEAEYQRRIKQPHRHSRELAISAPRECSG